MPKLIATIKGHLDTVQVNTKSTKTDNKIPSNVVAELMDDFFPYQTPTGEPSTSQTPSGQPSMGPTQRQCDITVYHDYSQWQAAVGDHEMDDLNNMPDGLNPEDGTYKIATQTGLSSLSCHLWMGIPTTLHRILILIVMMSLVHHTTMRTQEVTTHT